MRLAIFVLFISAALSAQNIAYVTDKNTISMSVAGGDTVIGFKHRVDTGNWIIYFDSTQQQIAFTHYFLGNNRSNYKSYYSNGQPKEYRLNNDSTPYYKPSLKRWFPDGQIQLDAYITRDTSFGRNWWSNGQLAYYKKSWGGKPWNHDVGEKLEWHPSGIMYRRTWWNPDSTIVRSYHSGGELQTLSINKPDSSAPYGSSCCYMHSFHPNGQESSTTLFPNLGRQPITYFYPSGVIKEKGDWYEGRIGPHKEWYESGKIKSEGNYSVGIIYFPNHKSYNYYPTKSGHWIYFSEAGWKEKEEWRELDGTITFKEYNEKGEVINEGESQEVIHAGIVFPEEYQH